ncbi:MAG: photosynthetic complex putative assembly protein PuhB [Oceanicaulis sp.]
MCNPDDIKPDPIPGLPEELPEGERILWRGSPDWRSLALHVFHVRAVAIYFAALLAWKTGAALAAGGGLAEAAMSAGMVALFAAAALGLLLLFARLTAKATIYTITNARVVMRIGVALPKTVNVPFTVIGSAALKLRKGGDGDIPMQLVGPNRAAYLHLWPHARPWRLVTAEPMLRGIPDAAAVANILAGALAEKAGQPAARIAPQPAEAETPRRAPMPGRAAMANG